MIRRLLDKTPELRITAQQSLEQEFFKPLREQKLSFVRGAQLNEDLFRDLIGYRGISQLKKAALNLLVRDCMDRGSQGAAASSTAEIDHNSALEEQIRRLEEQFKLIDKDGSGLVNANELAEAMRDMNIGVADGEIEKIIREIDYVGNGKINYTEFLAATLKI